MMSASELSRSHTSFWRDVAPMMDSLVRSARFHTKRLEPPIESTVHSSRRAFVNTLGELVFGECRLKNITPRSIHRRRIDKLAKEAAQLMIKGTIGVRLPPTSPESAPPSGEEIEESLEIARRLTRFFARKGRICVQPEFSGCGRLPLCRGDVLAGVALYEIKSGERELRAVDIRQLLLYCALNYASKEYVIDQVGVVNPRRGICVSWFVADMVSTVSAAAPGDLFHEIIYYISRPDSSF